MRKPIVKRFQLKKIGNARVARRTVIERRKTAREQGRKKREERPKIKLKKRGDMYA